MNRKALAPINRTGTLKIFFAAALVFWVVSVSGAQALEPPRMPYVFGMYCFMCHKEGVQIGPMGMFDMQSKSGNPLHEQFIRNNVRFGIKAMPSFRISEVSPKELDEIVKYLKELAAYRKANPGYQPAPVQEGGVKK